MKHGAELYHTRAHMRTCAHAYMCTFAHAHPHTRAHMHTHTLLLHCQHRPHLSHVQHQRRFARRSLCRARDHTTPVLHLRAAGGTDEQLLAAGRQLKTVLVATRRGTARRQGHHRGAGKWKLAALLRHVLGEVPQAVAHQQKPPALPRMHDAAAALGEQAVEQAKREALHKAVADAQGTKPHMQAPGQLGLAARRPFYSSPFPLRFFIFLFFFLFFFTVGLTGTTMGPCCSVLVGARPGRAVVMISVATITTASK